MLFNIKAHTDGRGVVNLLTVCLVEVFCVWPGAMSKVWKFGGSYGHARIGTKWFVNRQLGPCRVLVLAYAALLEMIP